MAQGVDSEFKSPSTRKKIINAGWGWKYGSVLEHLSNYAQGSNLSIGGKR
jgi:hypothetical protein